MSCGRVLFDKLSGLYEICWTLSRFGDWSYARENANGRNSGDRKNNFCVEVATAGSWLSARLAVSYFVDDFENLLDAPGTSLGKILVEPSAPLLCDRSRGRLWSSSKTMQAQGRLNFTSETFLMYDTVAWTFQESRPYHLSVDSHPRHTLTRELSRRSR